MARITFGKWGYDKVDHFVAGVVLTLLTLCVWRLCGYPCSVWFTISLAVAYALGKEVFDYFHPEKHRVEVLDAVMTLLGGFLTVLVIWSNL